VTLGGADDGSDLLILAAVAFFAWRHFRRKG
jgi:hypothetical protein